MNNFEYSKYLDNEKLVIFLLHGVINDNPYLIRNYNKKHILSYEFEIFLKNLLKIGNAISMDQVYDFCIAGYCRVDVFFCILNER